MATQVPHEGSDMSVYEVGCSVKQRFGQLIEAYSMTLEAVETKLMWVLGQTNDPGEIRRLFYTPIARDIL
jgi:L-asparaginase